LFLTQAPEKHERKGTGVRLQGGKLHYVPEAAFGKYSKKSHHHQKLLSDGTGWDRDPPTTRTVESKREEKESGGGFWGFGVALGKAKRVNSTTGREGKGEKN